MIDVGQEVVLDLVGDLSLRAGGPLATDQVANLVLPAPPARKTAFTAVTTATARAGRSSTVRFPTVQRLTDPASSCSPEPPARSKRGGSDHAGSTASPDQHRGRLQRQQLLRQQDHAGPLTTVPKVTCSASWHATETSPCSSSKRVSTSVSRPRGANTRIRSAFGAAWLSVATKVSPRLGLHGPLVSAPWDLAAPSRTLLNLESGSPIVTPPGLIINSRIVVSCSPCRFLIAAMQRTGSFPRPRTAAKRRLCPRDN